MHNLFNKIKVWLSSNDYKHCKDKEKKNKTELNKFLEKFTIPYIQNMDIDEYVIGKGNKNAFCPWLENGLQDYGSLSGHTNAYQKYVIYWDKTNKKYCFGDKRTKKRRNFGDNEIEIFQNIKKSLIEIIESTKNKQYQKIADNPLNPQFKNKISFLYDSNNQLPIYGEDDLDLLLTIFNIPYDKNTDRIFKRIKLYNFYCQSEISTTLTPYLFMCFIYSNYGYIDLLRRKDIPKPNINAKAIEEYSLIDIKIQSPIESSQNGVKQTPKIYNYSDIEEIKRITGSKAEDIVIEYLKKHAKKLDVNNLKIWCREGDQKDDSKGYDLSYELSNGTEILCEIKGTKSDLKQRVCFEMSKNEFTVMKKHPDTYYVFFVNDVNNGKEIKRILGKNIYGEIPTKYKIDFKYTE